MCQKELISKDAYARFLGITFNEIKEGYCLCSLEIKPQMLNFMGTIHGGVIFSLADAAFSAASNYQQQPSMALDISGTFLKTAKVGDLLTAEAKIIHSTKRTGLYRMDVFHQQLLLATFNGTVFRKTNGG